MKKIITLALATMMMVSCVEKTEKEIEHQRRWRGFNFIVVDSCEYIIYHETSGYHGFGYLAHKGNCRFCKERRKQELKEFVE